jgi:hypothetical protein
MSSAVIYIIAMGFIYMTNSTRKQEIMDRNRVIAKYLSQAGIEKSINEIAEIFYSDLLDPETKKVNMEKLNLLDYEKAANFIKVVEFDDLIEGGKTQAVISVTNITNNPSLGSALKIIPGEEDKIPDTVNAYKDQKNGSSDRKLGGYVAKLKITSKGTYSKRHYVTTVTRSLKITNVAPVGEEYTLFIEGEKEEFMKFGKFTLSNWTVDMDQVKNLVNQIQEMSSKKNLQVPDTSINDFASSLNFVKNFVLINKDSEIKKEASALLFNLDFRRWGRVRTNGTLHVFLPFFEVDDIINYFVENKYYSKPEVGYVGCFNMLHNPYLGKYTRYEGNIRKNYYRLAPYILSRRFPVERSDKYTRFSTDSYYPQEHADEKAPSNNILTRPGEIEKFIHQNCPTDLVLRGTPSNPITVNGIMNIEGSLTIGGNIKGKGALIVKGTVLIENNIECKDKTSLVSIISLNNPVIIKNSIENVRIDTCLYSKESVKGGKSLKINGNLVVYNLNRQSGQDARVTDMPKNVEINYNKNLRNYYGKHVYGGISRKSIDNYLDDLSDSDISNAERLQKYMYK